MPAAALRSLVVVSLTLSACAGPGASNESYVDDAIARARAFTVGSVFGTELEFEWQRDSYCWEPESSPGSVFAVEFAVEFAVLMSEVPTLSYDVEAALSHATRLADAVGAGDVGWTLDGSGRPTLRQFGGRLWIAWQDESGSEFVPMSVWDSETETGVSAIAGGNWVEVHGSNRSRYAKSLAVDVFGDLGGSWSQCWPWEVTTAEHAGRRRVLFDAVGGEFGEPGAVFRYLLEEIDGVFVPIVYYTRDEFMTVLRCYRYRPTQLASGATRPFPVQSIDVLGDGTDEDIATDGLSVDLSEFDYRGAPESVDALRIPLSVEAFLRARPGVLTDEEQQGFDRTLCGTWPERVLALLRLE